MEKRYEESAYRRMLKAVELSTGHRFTDPEMGLITRGPNELDIVNSGLEETMVAAYHETLETWRRYPGMRNLRTAAFFNAIEKVARAYLELGIFP
jgi:glutamate dehydrogenase (NAD(P)+)